MLDVDYMRIAISEAKISDKMGEVPVGAVITNAEGQIIAQGHNLRKTTNDPTAHAEIITIRLACQKLSTYHLNNCSIYVTLEPCIMCFGAILNSRISHIFYGTAYTGACSLSLGENNLYPHPTIRAGVLKNECDKLIETLLQKKKKKALQ